MAHILIIDADAAVRRAMGKTMAVSAGMSLDHTGLLEDAEALGADASLQKPFDVKTFTAAVDALLRG